jgi:hypothetical protein
MEIDPTAVTIAIDNGLKGALCAIRNTDSAVIGYTQMPVEQIGDKEEIDVKRLLAWVADYGSGPLTVCIEEPLKHAKNSQAMRSMSISFGKIDGSLRAVGVTPKRVQVKDWQTAMLGKNVPKGQTKEFALRKAKILWPEQNWLATPRSRVPHDGVIDAALIAHYYLHSN